jgi:hypothetical protein
VSSLVVPWFALSSIACLSLALTQTALHAHD